MDGWTRMEDGTAPAEPNRLDDAEVREIAVPENGGVPNHPDWPGLVVAGALPMEADIDAIKALLERNRWFRVWDWTVFDYHHFHPGAAEVLAVARGGAEITLGGPYGRRVTVCAGDVMVLPPGFGHKLDASWDGFRVVGAYPEGQEDRRIVRPGTGEADGAATEVALVPRPATDPIWGTAGPVLGAWGA